MKLEENIRYREVEGYDPLLNTLDIYYRPLERGRAKKPVIVFLHGGNWTGGDKSCFVGPRNERFPRWFVEHGYVFVAANFRLPGNPRSPQATVIDMLGDIAKAIRWLKVNGRRYGGAQTGFIIVGYSSGAHLAALLAANQENLLAYHLQSSDFRGVIALDVPHFDVPLALDILDREDVGLPNQRLRLAMLQDILGKTRAMQERVSPAAHLGPNLRQTAFLLLSAGLYQGSPQRFSRRMSERFRDMLLANGIHAEHRHFDECEHTDFISKFDADISCCVEAFLKRIPVSSENAINPALG